MCSSEIKFPEALGHSAISEVFPGVFTVMGTYIATYDNDQWQFSRNMTIVREGDKLTLINAIRLSEDGMKELDKLGKVKHVVKLGAAHGIDNPYYVLRYDAKAWALPGAGHEQGIHTDETLAVDHLPFTDAKLHVLAEGEKAEAVLLVQRDGGILLSCDSIKNWSEVDPYFSDESGEKMSQYGMIRPVDIDKSFVTGAGITRERFDAVLAEPFIHLIPGHGQTVKDTAHEQVKNAVETAFA
jgi:hypothetical protein